MWAQDSLVDADPVRLYLNALREDEFEALKEQMGYAALFALVSAARRPRGGRSGYPHPDVNRFPNNGGEPAVVWLRRVVEARNC